MIFCFLISSVNVARARAARSLLSGLRTAAVFFGGFFRGGFRGFSVFGSVGLGFGLVSCSRSFLTRVSLVRSSLARIFVNSSSFALVLLAVARGANYDFLFFGFQV